MDSHQGRLPAIRHKWIPMIDGFFRYWLRQRIAYLWRWQWRSGDWVLGRHACLGNDVIKLIPGLPPVFNVQKGRVDYWAHCMASPTFLARAARVAESMQRKYILPLIVQQQLQGFWPKSPPLFMLMDSFSELTDQLFVHRKDRWGFCCNYLDVAHDTLFARTFEEQGLLPLDELENHYRFFFNAILSRYGKIPIIFLHFPATLETRQAFTIRHARIVEVMATLAAEIEGLHSIQIDESQVRRPLSASAELLDFPYHFDHETYRAFVGKVVPLLPKNEIGLYSSKLAESGEIKC